MSKNMKTCQLCNSSIPTYTIINGKRRNLCKRKYCLVCTPFGSHNTKQLNKKTSPIIILDTKECPKCNNEYPKNKFYTKPTGELYCYCKECTKVQAVTRQRLLKTTCINYMGGKCIICGYDKCNAALEFHHLDPQKKEFSISQKSTGSFDVIKPELDKCILVCCRCHSEIHSGISVVSVTGIEPVFSTPVTATRLEDGIGYTDIIG